MSFKILVAEDNSINVQVAKFVLKPIASELDFVKNGEEAVEKFLSNEYDFIMMDVKMPVMDGFEATQAIRNIETERNDGKRMPIIAMTANNMYEEIQECLRAGMDAFLAKPFNTIDVKNMIKNLDNTDLQAKLNVT